eukprot:scaffold260996_cov33-Tisochrysis_lutea.AAC.7
MKGKGGKGDGGERGCKGVVVAVRGNLDLVVCMCMCPCYTHNLNPKPGIIESRGGCAIGRRAPPMAERTRYLLVALACRYRAHIIVPLPYQSLLFSPRRFPASERNVDEHEADDAHVARGRWLQLHRARHVVPKLSVSAAMYLARSFG